MPSITEDFEDLLTKAQAHPIAGPMLDRIPAMADMLRTVFFAGASSGIVAFQQNGLDAVVELGGELNNAKRSDHAVIH